MGLADRFKEKLENRDIFQKSKTEKALENNNIMFISKPIIEQEEIQPSNILQETIDNTNEENLEVSKPIPKFENLETEIIAKIRKTPYWEEFSTTRQRNMISNYFDVKTKQINSEITNTEKQEFINNVFTLSNNR